MLFVLSGLALATILLGRLVRAELRSAYECVSLSNGVEVLVSPEVYREIERAYATREDVAASRRWDEAVLGVLKGERPREWRYLMQTLGRELPVMGTEKVRAKQTVKI